MDGARVKGGALCSVSRWGDSHQEGGVGWMVPGSREAPCAASRVRGDSHQEGGAGWVVHGSREVPCAVSHVGGGTVMVVGLAFALSPTALVTVSAISDRRGSLWGVAWRQSTRDRLGTRPRSVRSCLVYRVAVTLFGSGVESAISDPGTLLNAERRCDGAMEKVRDVVLSVLRFLGVSLLIDLGLFAAVSLSCLIGPRVYSERMFWVSLAAIIAGMPAVLASLGTSRGYYDNPFTAGIDAQVAHTIIKDGRQGLSKRSRYAWRMFSIGIIGIGIAALIDLAVP